MTLTEALYHTGWVFGGLALALGIGCLWFLLDDRKPPSRLRTGFLASLGLMFGLFLAGIWSSVS